MRLLRWSVLLAASLLSVAPFLWLLSTSLKGAEEIFALPPSFLPSRIVPENFTGLWNVVPLGRYLMNSVIVTTVSAAGNVLFSSLAGYVLARFAFRGRRMVMALVLLAVLVPKEVLVLPLYTIVLKMHLADSLTGIVLPFLVDGMGIFLMRQAFLAVPREIEEAAAMEGASGLRLWWSVMMPMAAPSAATLAILTVIGTWGDFLWPLIIVRSPEQFTVPVGLSFLTGTFVDNFRYVAAGAVISLVPVFIVFVLMQRFFERGLFSGGGK